MPPQIVVLGSAAGGGVPQWNCRCAVCQLAWNGDARVLKRSQFSLAVQSGDEGWTLIEASPDVRQQIADTLALHPTGLRETPIKAVVLTGAEIDQIAGLLTLREGQRLRLFATTGVHEYLRASSMFDALDAQCAERCGLRLETRVEVAPGLGIVAFPVAGKRPLYAENRLEPPVTTAEDVVGLELHLSSRRVLCVPSCAAVDDALVQRARTCDILLFDGTAFTDAELVDAGVSSKTARRMGHVPITAPDGPLARLSGCAASRRIFVHLNNTNPALIAGSRERGIIEANGWEIATDGMVIRFDE